MDQPDQERREIGRRDLSSFYPTIFNYQGNEFRAHLVNLSETGAKFQFDNRSNNLHLNNDDILDFEVRSDKGLVKTKAVVRWVREKGSYYTWGVEFLEIRTESTKIINNILSSLI